MEHPELDTIAKAVHAAVANGRAEIARTILLQLLEFAPAILGDALAVVEEQANDDVLWVIGGGTTERERCLQAALRRLHAVIEGNSQAASTPPPKDWKETHPLPPAHVPNPSVPAGHAPVDGYDIFTWHPTPDPKDSKPAAVVFAIPIAKPVFDAMAKGVAAGATATMALRVKSSGELKRMVSALMRHGQDVWPEAFN